MMAAEEEIIMEQKDMLLKSIPNFNKENLVIGKYIACGTYGAVFDGFYDGKKVAVKLMDFGEDKNVISVFMQEISVWNRLDHPNVAKFIGATNFVSNSGAKPRPGKTHKPNNACCIVVEYLDGGTLESYLRKHRTRRHPLKVVIQLALDVARGLSYLHSQKIVHRDVKIENLLLDNKRRVKIIDFGISRFEPANPTEMTGGVGTKGYIAPEVLGCGPYDHKCDVFSFGICLWEIYSCERAYFNMSFSPKIPVGCPSNLADLMKQCWDGDPGRRPEMAEVVKILEAMDTSEEDGARRKDQPKGCFGFFTGIMKGVLKP